MMYLISIPAASVANGDPQRDIVSWLDGGGRNGEVRVLELGVGAVHVYGEGRGGEVKCEDGYKGRARVELTGRIQMGREELLGSNGRFCSPWYSW